MSLVRFVCAQKLLTIVLILVVGAAGCSGSQTSSPPEPTPTVWFDPGPTATPATDTTSPDLPVLSDDEKVAAAVAAFDSMPQPDTLIAWDHLGAQALGDRVVLDLCSWSGETVYSESRIVEYFVDRDASGEVDVRFSFSSNAPGDCLNTELIESVYEAANAYDMYWSKVLADPTTFDPTEAATYQTDGLVEISTEFVAGWTRDGLNWRGVPYDARTPDSAIHGPLWRSYDAGLDDIFELFVCRDLAPSYGLYQGDQLVDDFTQGSVGNEIVTVYDLVRADGRWRIIGTDGFAWSDCSFGQNTWAEEVTTWLPEPVAWTGVTDA